MPLQIVTMDPKGLSSADSPGVCKCDDGLEYVLKSGDDHPATPHAEWFCSELAQAVGIGCPPIAVIDNGQGELLFGSRWEGGVAADNWWDMAFRGDIDFSELAPLLSRVYAFDCFVHNNDRHLNNYLFRSSRNGWVMLVMDFSRAWLVNGFSLPPLPFGVSENTRAGYRDLVRLFGPFIDVAASDLVLDKIQAIESALVQNIIERHPKDWLADNEKNDILTWWKSKDRTARIDGIKRGIRDGSYL